VKVEGAKAEADELLQEDIEKEMAASGELGAAGEEITADQITSYVPCVENKTAVSRAQCCTDKLQVEAETCPGDFCNVCCSMNTANATEMGKCKEECDLNTPSGEGEDPDVFGACFNFGDDFKDAEKLSDCQLCVQEKKAMVKRSLYEEFLSECEKRFKVCGDKFGVCVDSLAKESEEETAVLEPENKL